MWVFRQNFAQGQGHICHFMGNRIWIVIDHEPIWATVWLIFWFNSFNQVSFFCKLPTIIVSGQMLHYRTKAWCLYFFFLKRKILWFKKHYTLLKDRRKISFFAPPVYPPGIIEACSFIASILNLLKASIIIAELWCLMFHKTESGYTDTALQQIKEILCTPSL